MLALRLLGIRRGWGPCRAGRAHRLDHRPAARDSASPTGTGAPTGWSLHVLAIGIPATMAVAVAFDLLARPGSLATGERAGLVVTPRPLRAVRLTVSGAAPLPRARCASPARRASARPWPAEATRRVGRPGRRPPAPGARGGRRRVREAGSDRGHPRRPAPGRDLRGARPAPEPGRARAGGEHAGGARGRVRPAGRGDRSPSSTGTRSPPRRSVRPTARGSTRARRSSSRSSGPASTTSSSATWPRSSLLADLAQRRTPLGQSVRSGEVLGQFAESLRAELDFLREVEAMAEMAALLGEGPRRPGPAGPPGPVHPAGPRAGALRGLHAGRHRPARRHGDRPPRRRRPAAAHDPRAGAADGLLPRRPASRATSSSSRTARSA